MKLVNAKTQYSLTNKAQTELFELWRKKKLCLSREWQTRKDKIVATLGTELTAGQFSKIIEVIECILLYFDHLIPVVILIFKFCWLNL